MNVAELLDYADVPVPAFWSGERRELWDLMVERSSDGIRDRPVITLRAALAQQGIDP